MGPAKSYGHVKITLQNQQRSYAFKELFDLRPGGIIARRSDCSDRNDKNNNTIWNSLVLGVIVSSSRDQLESSVSPFKCSILDDINIQPDDVLYVTVLENLVT